MKRNLMIRTLALMLVSVAFLSSAQAQFRASIRGVITDPQGAVVEGATVTLLNRDTNKTLVAKSDANGIYQFNQLETSPYTLTVEKQGFQKKVLDYVRIVPDQANGLDVQLELGATETSVTVSGATDTLDTETANVSGTITSNNVQHLPSFGRDVFQLTRLAPGVIADNAQGSAGGAQQLPGTQGPGGTGGSNGIFQTENGPQAIAGGQQYENNSVTVDGISTVSAVWGGTSVITPSEDSIQDVKIVSNAYDAEYGRFAGARIQVTSKPGTNQYHGSLFVDMHRPGLDAYQWDGLNSKPLRDTSFFTQFGGSIGGPIWKNKIFAFFNYETVRSPKTQTTYANAWYETPAFDQMAATGSIASQYLNNPGNKVNVVSMNNLTCQQAGLVQGVNCNMIPGQGLDIGSPLTTGLGHQDLGWVSSTNPGVGGGLDGIADIANYETASTSNYDKVQYNGRLDANLTQKDRLAFAIYWVPQSTTFLNGPARDYNLFHHSQINDAFSLIWDRTFSPSFLNEARINAAGWRWNEVADNPQSPVGLPTDTITTIGSANIQQFGPSVGSILDQWTYGLSDVATKVIGPHTLKFGGEWTKLEYLNQCVGCAVPHYNFFNLWDFLNDAPQEENAQFNPHTGTPYTARQDDRQNILGFFAQDDWKIRRNLTLNFGLRWNYFGPLHSTEGNMYVASAGSGADFLTGLNVHTGNAWNSQKANFGPQIGFSWSPWGDNRIVFRGGYGLNYNQNEIAITANVQANPGLAVSPTFNMSTPTAPNPGILYATSSNLYSFLGYPANPNAVSTFASNGLPASGAAVNVSIFPNTVPTMHVHHWSLEMDYDLGRNWLASLGYQGSASRNLFFHMNPNAYAASLGYTLNPQIGGGDYWSNMGYGNYNAMVAEVKHNFSHQFSADAQFTWAKSLDTASGPYYEQPYPYNLNLDYGRSDYDAEKLFKLYGLWQPNFFHGNGWKEKVVGGWSFGPILTLHSGFPWTPIVGVTGGSLYCGSCGYGTLYPAAYIGGGNLGTSNSLFINGTNFPMGGTAYFTTPTYTAYTGTAYGAANPETSLTRRNSLNGPGYKDVDFTIAKAFGLPKLPVLGEDAKLEIRANAYNLFNNLNLKPAGQSNGGGIVDNIGASNFGQDTQALAGRVWTLGARFNF
jgi:Carboxypeptidase regulatory-like domain/TonB dependent receptor